VALLAAAGTGAFKDVREACKAGIKVTREIKPDPKAKRRYGKLYEQFTRLYPALKAEFPRLHELSE
jgi:xylulokinase